MFKAAPEQQNQMPNAESEQEHPLMFTAPPGQHDSMFNAAHGQSPYDHIVLQVSLGAGGPIHLYHYLGPPGRLNRGEQNSRTVFLGNSPYELFRNHALKELCSQCGEVESISFLIHSEQAFVTFTEPISAQLAIQRLNGTEFGGRHLMVSAHQAKSTMLTRFPKLNRPKARDRGDSYSSQRSYASNRTVIVPRDNEQCSPYSHSRRSSFREPYNHVRNFSRQSNEAFISPPRGLISSVSEVLQHNAAMNRMASGMPLASIENHYGRHQQNKPNHEVRRAADSMSQTIQYNDRKENSPMKSDKHPMTPSRKSSFSSQGGGGQDSKRKNNSNKRGHVSRQNS